jgi:ribose transport system substrate-binding protein
MNKKKIISNVLVILIGFVLLMIYYETRINNPAVTASSMDKYKIYLVTMDKTSHYWHIVDQGASDMAKLLGVTYQWEAPKERIVDEQINVIKKVIEDGADALLVAASDPVKVSGVIEDAKAANIKIIYVDAPANEEAIITFATDNYSAGVKAGNTMINELEAEGIKKGSIGIVGVTKENTTTVNREKGFRDAINANGNYKLLDTMYTDGIETEPLSVSEAFINQNSDLVGLFGTNETTTIGVGNAIKASNKKITGIGFDMTDEIRQLIKDRYLKAVMVQNPYTMGYLGMAEAVAALKALDTGPPYIDTGVSIKTEFSHD